MGGSTVRREDLQRWLERGNEFGFVKETGTPDYIGWVLLRQRKPNQRALELMEPDEENVYLQEQKLLETRPYFVRVVELKRAVYESDRYETNEDFRVNEGYYFATLEEAEGFLRSYGYSLDTLKWASEIGAP